MFYILATLSSLILAQETAPQEFSIHRVEPQNRAIVASHQAQLVKVGEEFTIETPYGDCHLPVTQVIEDYFYVDTQQCQSEFVSKGTRIHSTRKIQVEAADPVEPMMVGETSTNSPEWMQTEFYQTYIKNRASAYLSYYTGRTLDGSLTTTTSSMSDWRGSNTMGIGADYRIANLPYSLSVMSGFAYSLPRSYGSFNMATPTSSGRVDFLSEPELEMLSVFVNLRYQFSDRIFGVFGVNRLFTRLSNLSGDMTGDFGFHVGARYYPTDKLRQFFVDGDINFYNMNFESQGTTADFRLTELEVKAGYTF